MHFIIKNLILTLFKIRQNNYCFNNTISNTISIYFQIIGLYKLKMMLVIKKLNKFNAYNEGNI